LICPADLRTLSPSTFGGDYEAYLEAHDVLGHGFGYREIVKPRWRDWRGRFRYPPRELWPWMVRAMRAANELRRRWVAMGGTGLRVAAAYRPKGGAKRSAHKRNGALDLDLLADDQTPENKEAWYELLVSFWLEQGPVRDLGLGLYCSPIRIGGIRGHVDACGYRTWQHWNGKPVLPPLARRLAEKLERRR